jgi:hypothetical protein
MNFDSKQFNRGQLPVYEIRIKNCIDFNWSEWFEGLEITQEADGNTLITGPVSDQSALYGLLKKIHQLGMQLISINQIERGLVDETEKGGGAEKEA